MRLRHQSRAVVADGDAECHAAQTREHVRRRETFGPDHGSALPGGAFDGGNDAVIRAAAADVAIHMRDDVGAAWHRFFARSSAAFMIWPDWQ